MSALLTGASQPQSASGVFVTSKTRLQVMDRVTAMYARVLG